MLILQRRAGESLQIGDDIRITVTSVDGGKVRLAISAPGDVRILRSELVSAAAAVNCDSAQEEASPAAFMHMLDSVLPRPGTGGQDAADSHS